ncbi:MAG: enoyl-CoA hydratase/isomerase family protein [Leptospiraceae bacterium]|nr:enoyl-CoA hydratase/isomerase family protein [Leptospiraceae bacterium]
MKRSGTIRLELAAETAALTIDNSSKRNAMSMQMWLDLPGLVHSANQNPSVKLITIRGAGDAAFASGADISEFKKLRDDPDLAAAYDDATGRAFASLHNSNKPVLALINGSCYGGGLAIALNCDLRLASQSAQFCLPPAKLGLGYGYENTEALVQIVGPVYAKEMIFTARVYPAARAYELGLVHAVYPDAEFEGESEQYIQSILNNAPLTIQAAKAAINCISGAAEPAQIEQARQKIAACFDSHDYAEGRSAFLDKRKVVFTGR